MNFTKQYQSRPADFRGHNFVVDGRTMTIPDVVPTLKEIILSGAQQIVGQPLYDNSYEEGLQRAAVQSAPLESILNARDLPEEEPANERREAKGSDEGGEGVLSREGDGSGADDSAPEA